MSSAFHFSELLSSLLEAKLQPGPLVPEGWKPLTELKISYGGKDVRLGNYLKTRETSEKPVVEFTLAGDEGDTYTLMLLDPDAPTPEDPKFAFWRHWVLAGLQSAPSPAKETKPALTAYLGPGAKDHVATPHRYIFLLFKEPAAFAKVENKDVGGEEFVDRRSFKADAFVEEHGLVLVGANWFMGVGDEFVEPIKLEIE
ncbi:phosphatidylethanolamine-binding protein [Calycina marina]|uniref:Phosphatidylethanolamine-binding protein n=1 Tax=Calycina marina TaxID=1763456 RepID=A0A9P7YUU8_9HELO|nr:phosphatidylethanolamine-binding protein [Calycina marina]